MKKIKIIGLFLVGLFILPKQVFAFSASVRCSAPSSVTVGQSFTVTISGSSSTATDWAANGAVNSSSNLRLTSGDTGSGLWFDDKSSISKSYTFSALSEGTATVSQSFKVTNQDDFTSPTYNSNTCTINIVKPAPATPKVQASVNNVQKNNNTSITKSSESSENSLKSLSIDGFKLNPDFDKDILEYTLDLSSDTKSIKIIAEKNDEEATVSGDGEVEVKEGQNTFQILVTAENGESRTYTITANVQESSSITVNIGGKKYTVLKKIIGLDAPTGFEKKNIQIDKTEIESFYNKKINYSLVALKDNIGNISLFIYDARSDEYMKYSPIVSDSFTIVILSANEKNIPHNYHKSKFKYNNDEVIGYAIDEKSDFRLIYGINAETGKKGFYLYDTKYNTVQRFDNDQVKLYKRLLEKLNLAFIIFGSAILFLIIVIIILLSKNAKFKSKYLKYRLNDIDNPTSNEIKYQELEGTKTMTAIELNDKKDKKNKKKKEKTFLDE